MVGRLLNLIQPILILIAGKPSRAPAESAAFPYHHQRGMVVGFSSLELGLTLLQEKLNEAVALLNRNLQVCVIIMA